MRILKLSFLVFSVLFLTYGISDAQHLLVTATETCDQGGPGPTNATLYVVNPENGGYREIGPVGFNGVGALAQIGDGRLVAAARADADGDLISILIEIDPISGQGSLIGTTGSLNGPGCGRVSDLTYDPVSDTLYGTGIQCAPGMGFNVRLLEIDPDTGEGSIIGPTGFQLTGNALAIDSLGNLFSSGCCINTNYQINPQTGVGTFLSNIQETCCNAQFPSATFNPKTGEFIGTFTAFNDTSELTVLDPFTGDITPVGQLPDCADGIAFVTLPPRPIPTLSEWGLIAMAGVLAIIGLLAFRKRSANSPSQSRL